MRPSAGVGHFPKSISTQWFIYFCQGIQLPLELVTIGSKDKNHRPRSPGSSFRGVGGIHWVCHFTDWGSQQHFVRLEAGSSDAFQALLAGRFRYIAVVWVKAIQPLHAQKLDSMRNCGYRMGELEKHEVCISFEVY